MEQSQMIPPQQPSVEELRREMEESMVRAGLREDPAKVEDPTLTFWQKLVTTSGGKSRASEMARSAARGATGAVKELQETAAAHGNPIIATGAKLGAKITSKVQSLFGEQSDDPVSAFTESAVQFIAPFAAGGALGLESKMGMVAGGAARGAAVDLTAFDAQAGNIGDLLAKIPDRGAFSGAAKAFGELLTVEDDDSEAVGKAKNAAAGIIPGVVLDGVVALSRFKRARKAGDVAGAEANATILKNIAEGTHVPDGAHVKVAPNEDGTFRIEPTQPDTGPLVVEKSAEGVELDLPKFPTREAAEAQAETINFAMNEQLKAVANAGGLTEGQANEVRRVFQRMLTSPGPVDMQKLLEGTHFNFSYMNEPKETLAMIEAISEVFEKELKAARSTEGISHERQVELANEILGSVHPDQIPGVMAQVVGKGTTASLPARLLAANFAMREVAGKAVKLFDMVEARPNDAVAFEQARLVAKNLLELQEAMASASSNTGRALEIHKAFDEIAGVAPKAGAPKVKPETKPSFDSPKAQALVEGKETERTARVKETKEKVRTAKAAVKKAKEAAEKAAKDRPNPGPNTLTVADEADLPGKKGSRGESGSVEKQGLNDGTRDTQGANANDFSRSRERAEAIAALKKAQEELKDHGISFDPEVLADNRSLRGEKVKMQGDLQKADPLAKPDGPALPGPKNPIEELSKWLDQAEDELDKVVKKRDAEAKARQQGQKLPEEVSPFDTHIKETKAGRIKPDPVAGMDRRQILTVLRMAKMAGGEPRNLFAVGHAVKPLRETGNISVALEVFINFLLTSPKVTMTALASGAVESTMRAAGKIVAGMGTLNGPLAREGVDIIYGNLRFFADNFKAAQASLRAGRSIINPVAPHEAISGPAGAVIRTPSKVLGAADEFTRVTNYRSYVRAKSLRVWREKGLSGQALIDQVEKDLAAAFDAETGIATIPAALKYAEGPTLSAPLTGSLGQGLTKLVETVPALRFIVPFLRTGVNAFNANLDRTPLINLLVKRNREIFKKGGEEAAELAAQTAIAGSIYAYAYLQARAGELTGRGPSDPGLRKLWLKDHQPYSIRIGDKWVSYRRLDPTFTPLGLVADWMMVAEEQERRGEKGADIGNIATATVAAMSRSLTSATYMRGATEFLTAWSSGNERDTRRWLQGMFTAVSAPSIVNYFNDDPYYREVDGYIEATMARYPGLSEKLPARYDVFGEPEMRFPSKSIFPSRPAQQSIATELLTIGRAFPSMPQKIEEGAIDLGDREKFGENGVSPWERMQELLREPKYGRPALKDRLETLVESEKWQNASAGSVAYPGGERYAMASRIIDAYQRAALLQTIKEFPKLKEEIRLVRKIQGKAFSDGQEGVEELLRTLGK